MVGAAISKLAHLRELGVAGKDHETARRIRTTNVVAMLAAAMTAFYCLTYWLYDWRHFRAEIILLLIVSPMYLAVLGLTARGMAKPATRYLSGLALIHMGAINWMLGAGSGALSYCLIIPVILALIVERRDHITIGLVLLGCGLIFAVVTFYGPPGSIAGLPLGFRQIFFTGSVLGAAVLASGVGLFFRWMIQQTETKLEREHARSERLLRAILPEPIAVQLKQHESRHIAREYPQATVLFADIVGFTRRAARDGPTRTVEELNRFFSEVDALAARHGIEKIKTVGDAYLAVSGVPEPTPDHAARMADFALGMMALASRWNSAVWPELRLRIAAHSGPVVAGVIGRTKFSYDIWGDTVNTTSRLEEHCAPTQILISAALADALPARFQLSAPAELTLRDKGALRACLLLDECHPAPSAPG